MGFNCCDFKENLRTDSFISDMLTGASVHYEVAL